MPPHFLLQSYNNPTRHLACEPFVNDTPGASEPYLNVTLGAIVQFKLFKIANVLIFLKLENKKIHKPCPLMHMCLVGLRSIE